MIPRWFLLPFVLVFSPSNAQISIDDIITRALSLVRPIFDTSAPLQNDAMVPKPLEPSQSDRRANSILGSRAKTPLDDLPFCRGNSRICQFLSCSAENFKKDPTFGNIQLGAQILGDKKLRQAVSSNPEAIDAVCREQGMGADECKLFSKGFQLIDKFITTIEEPKEQGTKIVQSEPIPIPIQKDNEVVEEDYSSYPVASDAGMKSLGSQTWSSHPAQPQNGSVTRLLSGLRCPHSDAQMYEVRNDLVASLTPPPLTPGLPSLFFPSPLKPIAPPAPPTAPPLAFPTVPSLILPTFKLPELDKGLFFPVNKYAFGPPGKVMANEVIRMRRSLDDIEEYDDFEESVEKIRSKRDYYDELSGTKAESSTQKSGDKKGSPAEDYYGALDDDAPTKAPPPPNPLRDCVNLLVLRG